MTLGSFTALAVMKAPSRTTVKASARLAVSTSIRGGYCLTAASIFYLSSVRQRVKESAIIFLVALSNCWSS